METFVSPAVSLHARLEMQTTQATEFIDLTDRVAALVARAGLRFGLVNVQTLHTTTGIVLNEHEPLLLTDFAALLERIAPAEDRYAHDDPLRRTVNLTDEERRNGHAHCRALFLPSSATLNVVDGTLQLGRWQRLFLVELDGPRRRIVSGTLMGEGAR